MQDKQAEWSTLLRAANTGDANAYALFLRSVTPVLRGVVRARGAGLGPEEGEDIVQEVLLAIHLKRHTWRDTDPVAPWLYAIARHKVVDAFRRRGRRIFVPVDDFAEIIAAPPDPDRTERSDMERMIGMLEPRAAQVVRAIGIEGDSIADIGQRLGMTEGAVRVMLHRGLKKLSELRERFVEL